MQIRRSGTISEDFSDALIRHLAGKPINSEPSKEFWQMTKQEFMDFHRTGWIPQDAYEKYETREGLSWLSPMSKNPVLHSRKTFNGKEIQFRQSGEKSQYTRLDENDYIVRDEKGLATYLTDEEIRAKKLPTHDSTIVAYDDQGAIGLVSNEFGVPGVWVIKEYQGKGIGTYLLSEWMKDRPSSQKMGQMTDNGKQLTFAYHRKLIQKAIEEGKPVPPEVLQDYPELKGLASKDQQPQPLEADKS